MNDPNFSDHKLCGYLCAVLTVTSSQLNETIGFGTRCEVVGEGTEVSFRCETGAILSPVKMPVKEEVESGSENVNGSGGGGESSAGSRKKRMTRLGMANGSMSVVHQIHALVNRKCLLVDARVICVEFKEGSGGELRVVVLVDVYLPIAVWSGWRFPRSASMAGALLTHLSCDWNERSSFLSGADYCKRDQGVDASIWNVSECHVLGCKLHRNVADSSRKKLFQLHEIFRSLPAVGKQVKSESSKIKSMDESSGCGIWEISDDILINILGALRPIDLVRVAATCQHLRSLAVSVMPCMKLKLFPHQQTAIEWMLHRERNAKVLPHPLFVTLSTEDGFTFHVNSVSGEILTGVAPTINDFRGGMFCDEPGLGKTVTALSLILKTQGTLADAPNGVQIVWCQGNGDLRCGYYELRSKNSSCGISILGKRDSCMNAGTSIADYRYSSHKRSRLIIDQGSGFNDSCSTMVKKSPEDATLMNPIRCRRSVSNIKRNLSFNFEGEAQLSIETKVGGTSKDKESEVCKRLRNKAPDLADRFEFNDTWVQCEACHKWRRLEETSISSASSAWFCRMNTDPLYQSCKAPEEAWHDCASITYLPGFHAKGTSGGDDQNVLFFTSVLKEHYTLINTETKKALKWLAQISPEILPQMETTGLRSPFVSPSSGLDVKEFHRIFEAFALVKRVEKGVCRWFYPRNIKNLAFDVAALRMTLSEPLDCVRFYLSSATLIVVPSNLVDHWKTQIEKHVLSNQLRIYVWTDHKNPSAHSLAWDYDVVITTFSRLSAEWRRHRKSSLMEVHWLRIILDEGHTLGSSLSLTNKLQMAISLIASNRWILTGTPTPNTPNSQLSHLRPLLKFLLEEAYGQNHKSWETAILRPFESEMDEGRSRLLHLLNRCMISARKVDLQSIPPCIKKVIFVNFSEEHARSYNKLVLTVRRNILMADWNDPSHVESLLNPKQWKFRSATIKNIRLSCCVAGHIKVTHAGEDIQETMDILVGNGLVPASEEYASIRYSLLFGGKCARCAEWCRLPIITPCRHLLCLDCVSLDSTRCTYPGCGYLYEMQSPDALTRPENPNPKWHVPKDLIELQPSYKQDNWDPDWQSTSSSKVSYLVQQLKALEEANREAGLDPYDCIDMKHAVEFGPSIKSGTEELIQNFSEINTAANGLKPEKVLIFSQFLEHIHVIEQQLTIARIKYARMYSPMHNSDKKKSLFVFQHDSSCMALLMDGSAALGLDLSFVTHVYLMEPIWDRSMEEQVISRAHRMGATRPIYVETLAMRGTIEEQMLEFLQDGDKCTRLLDYGKSNNEDGRGYRSLHDFAENSYLSKLSFVHSGSSS